MSEGQTINRCPHCGDAIFANAVCALGEPINCAYPVYLVDIALNSQGRIVNWRYQGDQLEDSIDTSETVTPAELHLYCDSGHDLRALLRNSN